LPPVSLRMSLPHDRDPHPYDTHMRLPTVPSRAQAVPLTAPSRRLNSPRAPGPRGIDSYGDQRLSNYLTTFAPAPKTTRAMLFGTVDNPALMPPPPPRRDGLPPAASRLFAEAWWSFDQEAAAAHTARLVASTRVRPPHLHLPAYTHELPRPGDEWSRLSSPRLNGMRRRKGSPTRPHTSSPRYATTGRPKPPAARPGTSGNASSSHGAAMLPRRSLLVATPRHGARWAVRSKAKHLA